MKAITLRNIPPRLARAIEKTAARSGLSLNKAVIRLLEEGLGLDDGLRKPHLYDDLDELAGSWTAEEAAEFDEALRGMRTIDPELWK